MNRFILMLVLLVVLLPVRGQYLAAFHDADEQFWAFEAGNFTLLEENPVLEFQVGANLIAYLDEASNFKVYEYGVVTTLLEVAPVEFTATDYLLGFSMVDTLFVYDNIDTLRLSNNFAEYVVLDSLVVWQDRDDSQIQVFYNGQVITMADNIPGFSFASHMGGDNVFALVHPDEQELLAFYRGAVHVLDEYAEDIQFRAGMDVIAFADAPDQRFNAFYHGKILELDLFYPESFQVGDQMVAYLDDLNKLKIFMKDSIQVVASQPEFYELQDRILVFKEQGAFKTVCNGEVYILEQFVPEPYYLDMNTIAYLVHNKFIRVFQHCSRITANNLGVIRFTMARDVIVYAETEEKIKVYFNGQVFELP